MQGEAFAFRREAKRARRVMWWKVSEFKLMLLVSGEGRGRRMGGALIQGGETCKVLFCWSSGMFWGMCSGTPGWLARQGSRQV